jgi:hypothetical protein
MHKLTGKPGVPYNRRLGVRGYPHPHYYEAVLSLPAADSNAFRIHSDLPCPDCLTAALTLLDSSSANLAPIRVSLVLPLSSFGRDLVGAELCMSSLHLGRSQPAGCLGCQIAQHFINRQSMAVVNFFHSYKELNPISRVSWCRSFTVTVIFCLLHMFASLFSSPQSVFLRQKERFAPICAFLARMLALHESTGLVTVCQHVKQHRKEHGWQCAHFVKYKILATPLILRNLLCGENLFADCS